MEPKLTQRQKKINRLLQKTFSQYFLEISKKESVSRLIISVSNVRVTADGSLAKIYLSVFPTDNGQSMIDQLEKKRAQIKYDVVKRYGKQMKRFPDIHFYLDDTLDYIQGIEQAIFRNQNSGISEELI
ncbi:MAG: ribosome-binding factor A [Flavobacteriaceae bacterium]|nr:ribosome-binding factor A [Flavobacteriaceae bacterium]MCY4253524.1 ribosome-binding factor A [Flavobacteriaceae bacterium]